MKYLQLIVLNQDLLLLVTHGATMSSGGGKCCGLRVGRFEILSRPWGGEIHRALIHLQTGGLMGRYLDSLLLWGQIA